MNFPFPPDSELIAKVSKSDRLPCAPPGKLLIGIIFAANSTLEALPEIKSDLQLRVEIPPGVPLFHVATLEPFAMRYLY